MPLPLNPQPINTSLPATPLHQPKFKILFVCFPRKTKRSEKKIALQFNSMSNQGYRSQSPTSTLHHKRQSRSICLPACFSSMSNHPFDVLQSEGDYCNNCSRSRSPLPEIKDRCLNLISRISGGARPGRGRRCHGSADFSYDPSSYALNFEDDTSRADDQLPFSARLSASSIPTTSHEKKTSPNQLDEILENQECFVAKAESKGTTSQANGVASRRRGRSRHSSTSVDFSYEPSSYAMNFEDDVNRDDELISHRRFGGLLAQPSPSKMAAAAAPPPAKRSTLRPEIAAFS
ncbi:PREDICTED: LOC105637589 [Prunus dulcis]|uniref:PREDICTED: LOC105637589 n=1 Tax=Prunus dulcis TaxID=3755 RepID=A0A5E4F779_PRUDU|nr:uncharacterized protein LOC117616177 [Prunus dulcis]VVA23903.1 PREDICTED: LOC105637589 [Prunus dulcis]